MKDKIKRLLKAITPIIIKRIFEQDIKQRYQAKYEYSSLSYAQEGEDLILQRIFENKEKGFFIDVGAHHPKRFSNTYLFYKKGWTGINIDPIPGVMTKFNEIRPNDINLEIGICDKEEVLTYYIFNEPALNTFSEVEALKKQGLPNYKIIQQKKIKVLRLETILDKYLAQNQEIDFLSIDVEGLDMQVLKSNNWDKYRPTIVLVESLDKNKVIPTYMKEFMDTVNYTFFAKTFNTIFFIKKENT